MLPDKNVRCPATGFAKTCREIVTEHTCPKFISIKGKHPQTGDVVDNFGCADSFLPLIMIETTQQMRQVGAALESFRNEVVKANEGATQEREAALQRLGLPRLASGR